MNFFEILKSILFSKCRQNIMRQTSFVHISKTGFFVFWISNVCVPNFYLHAHFLKQDEMSANNRQKIVIRKYSMALKGCVKKI